MSNHTWENYDENEYFIKFLEIHPYLVHSNMNNDYNKKKLKFQKYLLKEILDNNMTKQEMVGKYNLLILKENEKYSTIEHIKQEQKKIINNISTKINNDILEFIENLY